MVAPYFARDRMVFQGFLMGKLAIFPLPWYSMVINC